MLKIGKRQGFLRNLENKISKFFIFWMWIWKLYTHGLSDMFIAQNNIHC